MMSDQIPMGVFLVPVLIPFRFLGDRRKKWDQSVGPKRGTKAWDQKVGPKSGSHFFFFVILIFKHFYFSILNMECLDGRAHKTLAYGARGSRIASRSMHTLFSTFRIQKVEMVIRYSWGESAIISLFPFRSSIPTFLLKAHFRTGRIYMGRNDDFSCVILTIQTVPLPFKKVGLPSTTNHRPHEWIFVG